MFGGTLGHCYSGYFDPTHMPVLIVYLMFKGIIEYHITYPIMEILKVTTICVCILQIVAFPS